MTPATPLFSEQLEKDADYQVLKNRVLDLEQRVLDLEIAKDRYGSARLDVSDPKSGFERIESESGTFLMSLDDAAPYLNGFRVKVMIGNPSSANYNGFKLTAKWGRKFAAGVKYAEWKKSLREKEFTFLESLTAGAWTTATMHLAPAGNEDLGYLEVWIATDRVSLKQR